MLNFCWQPGRKATAHKSFTKTICEMVDVYNRIIHALYFRGYKWTNKGWKRNYVSKRMFTDVTYLWNIFTLSLCFQKVWFVQNLLFDKLPGQKQIQNLKGEFCIHIMIALFKQTRWLKHETKRIKCNAKCHILGRWNKIKIET